MDLFEERQSNEFHDKTKILKYLRLIDYVKISRYQLQFDIFKTAQLTKLF